MLALWIIGGVIILFGFVVFFGAPYLPSRTRDVRPAFESLYDLGEKDLLIDIGSGDGVILRLAAERGAAAHGYEINPVLVIISRLLCRTLPRVSIQFRNFWNVSFPDQTTIVYTFGDGRDIEKMAQKVERESARLQKSLYFMSYGFELKTHSVLRSNQTHFLYMFHPNPNATLQLLN